MIVGAVNTYQHKSLPLRKAVCVAPISAPASPRGGFLVPACAGHDRCVLLIFIFQLAPPCKARGVERASCDGGLDRAARLVLVGTISEAAFGGQLGDLGEERVKAGREVADMQAAHAERAPVS
ncbi:hypothetical protein BFP70_08885 [Thioclava sp. SK-1]|nr:hypothetical protein BFP70_08885 [Thioclava sp. SK-1]